MRRAARVDSNHAEIVAALRCAGCSVLSLAAVGRGVPDLLVYVWRTKRLALLEIKDGTRPPSERRLTPDQERFHMAWPVITVSSVDDAIAEVSDGPAAGHGAPV